MSAKRLSAPVLILAAALGGAAMPGTAEASPRVTGGGRDATVTCDATPGDTIVGGATARIQGGCRDAAVSDLDGNPHRRAGTPADIDERGHGG